MTTWREEKGPRSEWGGEVGKGVAGAWLTRSNQFLRRF